jgi:hypothetical protein
MKKIIFAALSLFLVLGSSCSNDDIEIETVAPAHVLTCRVNTQSLYDTFGITSNITNFIKEDDYSVGIYTYLYDAQGNLTDQNVTTLNVLNYENVQFDVPEGKYTLLTIETLVSAEGESSYWTFDKMEKLSTARIIQKWSEVKFPYVLGVKTNSISMTGDNTLSIAPEAIGSLVQVYFYNFDQTDYAQVVFGTSEIIDWYNLDPTLSREEKYYTAVTGSGIFNDRGGVEVSENVSSRTLYLLESSISWKFEFQKAENAGTSSFTYYLSDTGTATLEDGKTYYAGFAYMQHTGYNSVYFGDYAGYKEWYAAAKAANASYLPEVYTDWGCSVSSIQSKMSGYTYLGSSTDEDDGSYTIGYDGQGAVDEIDYIFRSTAGSLYNIDVWYNTADVSLENLKAEIGENYEYAAEEDDLSMYISSDAKTVVFLYASTTYIGVSFYDYSYFAGSSNIAPRTKSNFDEILHSVPFRNRVRK